MEDAAANGKAWKEMGHRYLAGSLGLVILGLALLAFAGKKYRRLSSAIVLLVLFVVFSLASFIFAPTTT